MTTRSPIEWTGYTWNPLTGCTKVSRGCEHCYAERMAIRLKAMGVKKYANGFKLTLHEDVLEEPLVWKKGRIIFVNSMSDLFHEDVPDAFIKKAFEIMGKANQSIFQVLTKRSKRLAELSPLLSWSPNVWMGVSVENNEYLYRVDDLLTTNAQVKFLSLEPLLDRLEKLSLNGIDWVIVGGESGPGNRPIKPEWVLEIRDMCLVQNIPFFFKQWGGVHKKKGGRILDGLTWDQMPTPK